MGNFYSAVHRLESLEERTLLSIGGAGAGQKPPPPADSIWLEDLASQVGADFPSLAQGQPVELLGASLGPYVEDQGLWLDFDADDGLDLDAAASVELISSTSTDIVAQVSVPGAWLEPVTLGDAQFTGLTVPGSGYTSAIGEPQVPLVRSLLTVPEGAEVTAKIAGRPQLLSMAELGLDDWLVPVQAPVPKLPGALESATLSFSQAAYQTDRFTPLSSVQVVESGYFAGQRLVMLEIAPIAYNPVTEAISVYDTLTVNVRFEGGQPNSPELSAGEDARLADLSINHTARPFGDGSLQTATDESSAKNGGRLLIICHDDFVAEIGPYVTYKTGRGWTVDLVDTSTAGTTNSAIRAYIRSQYDNLATRPDAVLLVGDTDRIPHFVGSGEASPVTDLYYGCMDDGDDWRPELPVGRFSVADGDQLGDVIEKTISYETGTGAWTTHVVFMASSDNYQISEGTHNYVIDNYMDPLGYTSDKLYRVTYGATTQDVRDSFNAGRSMGTYSGHGSTYSWADGPPFSQSDVRNLTNAEMYPLIASFACITGTYTVDECFMETWLRVPEKGAVVAVGSSVSSYWTEDDILEKRLYDAIFDEGYVAIGSAWVRAKELYYEHFGAGSRTRMYFEMYNVLGDPTVEVLGLDFGIRSAADLPLAYQGEPYQYTLQASSGTEPYTWALIGGALPAGLYLDPATGTISGVPTTLGTATFTIEVTDAAQATDSQGFHLPVVGRLQITTPGELPTAFLSIPYSVMLEAEGGTAPYTWSQMGAGEYLQSDPSPGYLGGGTAQHWWADDASWQLALPWEFPFYGNQYDSVWVCSNGFLDFASSSADYTNSQSGLLSNVRVAPLWDDLVTTGGGDVYVTENADYVAVRWDAVTYSGSIPVDFEAVLYRDGRILFNYGQAHSGLSPTIGISASDNVNYTLSSLNGATTIPADVSTLFAYRGLLPGGLVFDEATGEISGTPAEMGTFDLAFRVQDSGTPLQTDTKDFTLEVLDLPPLLVTLPEAATEGDGLLAGQGTVRIPLALAADLMVTLESNDPSEVTLPSASTTILAGQVSATFDLRIEDDTILDGTQLGEIIASAAGYYSAVADFPVHDNETATLTVTVPENATEDDGLLTDQGTVTVSAPPESDVVVALGSDDATEATVPATATIPAGRTQATFDVIIVDDTEIDETQTATITAHVENWTDGSGTIGVLDNDGWISLLLPPKVWEGQGTLSGAGTLVLGGTLPDDLEVSLASDDAGELTVPDTVTVPAGQTSARFDLFVQDDADYDGSRPVRITATAPDLTAGSQRTYVGDDDVHHFGIDQIADPQLASVPFSVTLTAKDVHDETIEVYQGAVDLSGAGDGGTVPIEIDPGAGRAADADAGDGRSGLSAAITPALAPGAKPTLGEYHSYDELTADLAYYAAAYPAVTQLVSVGQSIRGRELWALKITDNPQIQEDEPEVKYVSTMHGDEPVGTETCMYFIDLLLSGYHNDPRITDLVDETEIWILPLMNPDGREAGTRGNANGVDLNRNFPEGAYAPFGNVLDGPPMDTAGRQPETVQVMQWSAEQSFTLSANFHTGALLVNYPYDNDARGSVDSPTPDDELFEHVSEIYSVHNTPMWNSPTFLHGITNGAAWYSIDGGMQDWHYRYLGCNEVTIELSNVFWPDESTLPGFWADNQESMLSYFEAVHMGVRGMVTDALSGEPVFGSVTVVGIDHPVFTDPDLGDYHRMLLPGTYDLTFSAPGYNSRTVTGVVVNDESVARFDVPLVPLGAGMVFVDGRWMGEVAVHAVDTNVVLTADAGQGHTGASNPFDVVPGPVEQLQFSPISSPQEVSVPFPVTLTAQDAHGYTATDFQGTVELSGNTGAGEVIVGDGTLAWEQPMHTYWHDARTQVIYHADEIGAASTISALALDVTGLPGQTLNRWTIRIKHTPLDGYSTAAWEGSGWTTVYQNNEAVTSTGWVNFEFSTPFQYNGVDNLMVDFSYNNSSWTSDGYCRATSTGEVRSISYYTDSGYGDPLSWSGTGSPTPTSTTWIPNVKLAAEPSVPIAPTVSGNFLGGTWTGNLTVLEEAAEMCLWAEDDGGRVARSNSFDVVPVIGSRVVGRHVFYNDSHFDGDDPAPNALDDEAIAPDKVALLPGQTATFANYTSYDLGINGIMVDVIGLPTDTLTPDDFGFQVGNDGYPAGWNDAPQPRQVTVRPGAGIGGSSRVTILWDDSAIAKHWLQITVPASDHTGLTEPDVFYFGNAVGESGNAAGDTKVNAYDMLGARDNPRNFNDPATIDFPLDYNRDARVNAYDMLIARDNQTHFLNALKLITVPQSKGRWSAIELSEAQEAAAPAILPVPPPMPAESPAAAAHDAVLEMALRPDSQRREAPLPRIAWIYDLEAGSTAGRWSKRDAPAKEAVDVLWTAYWQ